MFIRHFDNVYIYAVCISFKSLRSLIIFGLALLPAVLSAQSLTDSLKQVLPEVNGTQKADVLNQLSWELKSSAMDKAISYGKEGLALAKSIDYKEGQAESSYNLSVVYYITQDFSNSDQYAEQAIEYYQGLEDITGIARSWNILGLNALSLGDHNDALNYFQSALEQFKIINNEENILKIEANIGNVHYRQGAFQLALQSYFRIVEYAREKDDQPLLINNLQNVGFAYSELGQYADALEVSFDVLSILREQNDSTRLPNTLQSIASTFNRLEMYKESIVSVREAIEIDERLQKERRLGSSYITLANALKGEGFVDSAFYYNKKALEIYEKVGNKSLGMVLNNLGNIYLIKGDKKEAEVHFNKGLEVSRERKREGVIALCQYNLGRLYIESEDFEKAEIFLFEAYEYWRQSKKYKELSSVTKELSGLYSIQQKHELALRYEQEHDMAEDSVFGRQKQYEVMRLIVRQNLAEQDTNLADMQAIDEDKPRDYSWMVVAVFLLVSVVWLTIYLMRKKQNTIERLQVDLDMKGRELAFLSLTAIQKENFISDFTEKLKQLTGQYPENPELRTLVRILKTEVIQDDHWCRFKSVFEQIAPHFFDHLLANYPNLTETDLRFCALIRLAIPTKEIARITGISSTSVNKARYRLRKRLEIGGEESLDRFILSV